ncbi:hypothetical protein [Salinibius halmophilus]|uniref:hypothetical protein n=1 Tax=Salinibius halmophilus TaxID=1853216 RepID=UPI000E65F9DD|nr:hypothetical protein [Salinibius halmophilus]
MERISKRLALYFYILLPALWLSTLAHADGFDGGDARSMAMGGTGTASADPYVAQLFNPALLANQRQSYRFSLLLPATSAYLDDQEGLFSYVQEFANTDLQAIQDLEGLQLNALLTALNGADPDDPTASEQDKLSFSENLSQLTTGTGTVLAEVGELINLITNSNSSDQADPAIAAAAQDVYLANDNLRGNNRAFESKLLSLQAESQRVQEALVATRRGIVGLDNRSLNVGTQVTAGANLGFSTFNTGFTFHSKSALELNALVETSDLDPIELAAEEIDNISGAASDASKAVTDWSNSIDGLTTALESFNLARAQYNACTDFNTCATALTALRTQAENISALSNQISDDSVSVNEKISGVTSYTTPGCEVGAANPKPESECPVRNGMFNFNWFSQQLTNTQNIATAIRAAGVVLTEAAITYSAELPYFGGFAVGVSPKLQHFGVVARDIKPQEAQLLIDNPWVLLENQRSYFGVNADIGLAKTWQVSPEGQVTGGLMVADIMPITIEILPSDDNREGASIELRPQLRLGAAYDWAGFASVSADIDVTRNSSVGIGKPSRYFGIGGELDLFNAAALRVGYRDNLVDDLPGAISAGMGVTPFGLGVSVAGYFIPSASLTEAIATFGVSGQLSLKF